MQIAFFTNFYLPVVNGVVRSVESFREALTNQGHNVFIFAQADGDYKDEVPYIFRYPSLPLPIQSDIPAVIPVSPFVEQLLPSLKLDVIHTHHPILLGQAAARKAADLSIPLVFTFHTQYTEYTHYFPLPQETIQDFIKDAVKNWLKDYMRSCQHIVIPSESMKETLVREYGLQDCYTVIPTGINLEPYASANGDDLRKREGWQKDIVLISIGRLAQEKNWPTLIQAIKKVYRKHRKIRLVLIGDGPERESLNELVAELGIANRVTFTGKVPFSEVAPYLKAADIFGFASVTETQGLVTLEAMAASLPVVAVDGSGTRDILENEKEGFLVANNPKALAASINQLIESPQMMKRFSKNALKKAETFEVRKMAKKLIKVYKQAARNKKEGKNVLIEEG